MKTKQTNSPRLSPQIFASLVCSITLSLQLLVPDHSLGQVPPAIASPPALVTVNGSDFVFSVSASGTAPLAYQWANNGVIIEGATNSIYTFTNGQAWAANIALSVTVTNLYGATNSAVVGANVISNSALYVCGYNNVGQLGIGNSNNASTPVCMTNSVAAVAAGSSHTLILERDGTLWACGLNSSGQLGIGKTIPSTNLPVYVTNDVAAVAAGSSYSLVLRNDGTLWACGANDFGQLGIGKTIVSTNILVYVTDDVTAVAAGASHTLILKSDGTLWACGDNVSGQLGIGKTITSTNLPVYVTNDVVAVAAGTGHTLILKNDGTLWACGWNSSGQLGIGNTTAAAFPVYVTNNVAKVAAGQNHTLIVKSDGSLWTCGWNSYGQLGIGNTFSTNRPVYVTEGVASVAAGCAHTLFVKTNGTIWSCGLNIYGQLGIGNTLVRYVPTAVSLPSSFKWLTFSQSSSHSSYFLNPWDVSTVVLSAQVITGPVSQTVLVGGGVSLITRVSPASVSCQWRHDGVDIDGATNSSLSFGNAQLGDAGYYDLVVSNNYGCVTSSVAVVSVTATGAPTVYVNSQLAALSASSISTAEVELVPGFAGGIIFYTLDGSTPDIYSTLYSGPFTLAESTIIRALCLSADFSQTSEMPPLDLQIIPAFYLNVGAMGSGYVRVYPETGPYPSNSVVNIVAIAPDVYWAFDHWQGDFTDDANPISLTIRTNLSLQAVFVPTAYPLTVFSSGGGAVQTNGGPIARLTYDFCPVNSTVTLTAWPSNGWAFLDWQGDATSTNNPFSLSISQAYTIQGVFGTSVLTNAVGGGAIVLNTGTNLVAYGSNVTASAVAKNGSYFVTWSGAATGTNSPAVLTVTSANASVNALFGTLPANKLSLSVVVMGNGGVSISPQQSYYDPGDVVTLNAFTADPTVTFNGWTGHVMGTDATLVVTMTTNLVIQANFGQQPQVSLAASSMYVLAGSNALLSASASGQQPLSYQWWKDGLTLEGATNLNHQITGAQTNDSGSYSLVVTSPAGVVTSAVEVVTVVFPPAIITPPAHQVVVNGSSASLGVSASGTPPLGYQWFNSGGAIAGATNSALDFNPALTNQWDSYYVTVSSSFGSVTSSPAMLVVYEPVSLIIQPFGQVATNGGMAAFSVLASGFPAPVYQWSLNGTNIGGATSSTLQVSRVGLKDLGAYSVIVSNGFSTVVSSAAALSMAPSILSAFNGAVGIWGRDLVLGVGATGSGDLNYQWFKDGAAILGATNMTLLLPALQMTNGGMYSVVVSSDWGSVTNTAAQVVVNPADVNLGMFAGVIIGGVVGYSYTIQYSTNLTDTNAWLNATNITLQQPVQIWHDDEVDARKNPGRFYRVKAAQ